MNQHDTLHDSAKPTRPVLQDINWHGRPGSVKYYQNQVDAWFDQTGRIMITRHELFTAYLLSLDNNSRFSWQKFVKLVLGEDVAGALPEGTHDNG